MDLSDLVKPDAVVPSLKANSKKQAIQALAEKAAVITGLDEREVFETLLQREKLGSTGVGGGIAIPHGKLAGSITSSASSPACRSRSISRRSTTSRSIWSFCCWRRKAPAPTI